MYKFDKFQLIAKVKERPLLWRVPDCKRNLNTHSSLWKQIADDLGIEEAQCRTTWRALRRRYELLKNQENSNSDFKKFRRKWKFYYCLEFLNDICNDDEDDICEVELDNLELIALIARQPDLWKIEKRAESIQKADSLWKEIGQTLGVDVNVCKKQWEVLRALHIKVRKFEAKRGETCTWEYREHLKFLDDLIDSGTIDTEKVDRYALIAKVKERPLLWRGNSESERKKFQIECMWREISMILDINYERCKSIWARMRSVYRRHKEMEKEVLKTYSKYFSTWEYYEHLKFLDNEDGEDTVDVDRYALIAKVKENPCLWKTDQNQTDENVMAYKWKKIATSLGVKAQTCRNIWMDLRLLYFMHKENREKLLKEKPYAIYDGKWAFSDVLAFLDDEAKSSNDTPEMTQTDTINLINSVKDRPYIWKTEPKERNKQLWKQYWAEIRQSVGSKGISAKQCETEWNELRSMYYNEKERIEFLTQNGLDDEKENLESEWVYFKYLKFLDSYISKDQDFADVVDFDSDISEYHDSDISEDQYSDDVVDFDSDVSEDQDSEDDAAAQKLPVSLINEIRKRPCLWKYYHTSRRGPEEINDMWSEVAKICGLDVKTCKSRWYNMKFRYKTKYLAFKENRIDIGTLRRFNNYKCLKFLNGEFDEELRISKLDKQNAAASYRSSGNADIDEEVFCENSNACLQSVYEKEEPQMQSASVNMVPLESIESISIKEEEEIGIYIKEEEEDSDTYSAIESQEYDMLDYEEVIFNINEEPNMDEIHIKEEFENDFNEQQATQFLDIENQYIKDEPDGAIHFIPIKSECVKVESHVENLVKTTNDSNIDFMRDEVRREIADPRAVKTVDFLSGLKLIKEITKSHYYPTKEELDVKPYISNWVKSRECSDIEFITDQAEVNEGSTFDTQNINFPSGCKVINQNSPVCASASKEIFDVKPNISHWVKNKEVSEIEFISDLVVNEEETPSIIKQELNLPIELETHAKIAKIDNSATEFNADEIDVNHKRPSYNPIGSKVLNKRRKKEY